MMMTTISMTISFRRQEPADEDLAVFFFEDDGLDVVLDLFTAESHVVGFSPGGAAAPEAPTPSPRVPPPAAALNARRRYSHSHS